MKVLVLIISSFLILPGCTRDKAQHPETKNPEKAPVISTLGETLMFDKSDIYVKAGEEITLTFVNNASAMKHNFVLVKPGKADEVGIAGIKAGEEKNYVPDSPDVIIATKLIAKGQEVLKFKTPPKGDYPFICSSAGHHTVMKGILHSL